MLDFTIGCPDWSTNRESEITSAVVLDIINTILTSYLQRNTQTSNLRFYTSHFAIQ